MAGDPPAGVIKIMGGKEIETFADLRTVSSYQGNNRLRRLYMINNYTDRTKIRENPEIYISSSRAINVVNCDTYERAVFERIYFSQPYALGEVVAKTGEVGQWASFPKASMMGVLADMVCQIDPARLKTEPPKERRTPLLDI
ncbi:surface-adhesin E family protein [Brenneria sp. MC1SB4.1]|uniref:Surface-adhesin E family protein n=1 Tax=Brenneria tiliae TaxID=2914984 RepID=A0ABT0MUB4_9GAMM|nr:surface-adhesin E family protein [Brenneria tiliae]